MTPTARTLDYCKKNKLPAEVVENYNHWRKCTHDLFGFIDILVIENGVLIGVQTTSTTNQSHRLKKITGKRREIAKQWLATGATIEVWGWGKYKVKRGGKAVRWRLTRTVVTL